MGKTADRFFAVFAFLCGPAFIALLVASTGCPKPPPPSPMPPDAADAMSFDSSAPACQLACQQISLVGCAEGDALTCVGRLSAIDALHSEPNRARGNAPLQCGDFAAVHTAADVLMMGQPCSPKDAGR